MCRVIVRSAKLLSDQSFNEKFLAPQLNEKMFPPYHYRIRNTRMIMRYCHYIWRDHPNSTNYLLSSFLDAVAVKAITFTLSDTRLLASQIFPNSFLKVSPLSKFHIKIKKDCITTIATILVNEILILFLLLLYVLHITITIV